MIKNKRNYGHRPRYSPRSAKALAFLKSGSNDIDIFVEDTGNHNMWFIALRRMLPSDIKFRSVNLLGGRNAVIEACRLDQVETNKPRLYIVDGDLDFVIGKRGPRLKNLYMLKAYCSENVIITESAILQIAMSAQPTLTPSEILDRLDFEVWYKEIVEKLVSLFILYGLAYQLDPAIQTVGFPIGRLCKQTTRGHEVCGMKTWRRMLEVRRYIARHGSSKEISVAWSALQSRIFAIDSKKIVSGKDYILPLLSFRLSRLFGYRAPFEQLKVELAKGWDALNEPDLEKRLKRLIR